MSAPQAEDEINTSRSASSNSPFRLRKSSTIAPETNQRNRVQNSRDFLLGVASLRAPPPSHDNHSSLAHLNDPPDSASDTLRSMLDKKSPKPSPRGSPLDSNHNSNDNSVNSARKTEKQINSAYLYLLSFILLLSSLMLAGPSATLHDRLFVQTKFNEQGNKAPSIVLRRASRTLANDELSRPKENFKTVPRSPSLGFRSLTSKLGSTNKENNGGGLTLSEKMAKYDFTLDDLRMLQRTLETEQKNLETELNQVSENKFESVRLQLNQISAAKWTRAKNNIKVMARIKKLNDEIRLYGTSLKILNVNINDIERVKQLFMPSDDEDESPTPMKAKGTAFNNYSAHNAIKSLASSRSDIRPPTRRLNKKFKRNKMVIYPDSAFRSLWGVILFFLMLYSAFITPLRLSFWDDDSTSVLLMESSVDCLFFLDIIITLFSAFYNEDGQLVEEKKQIMMRYFRTWFFLDICAIFPFQIFFDTTEDEANAKGGGSVDYSDVARVARIPRLWRLMRLTRLIVNRQQHSSTFQRVQDFFKFNTGTIRLMSFLAMILICVHLMGCIWYLGAKMSNFSPDCWVVRYSFIDADGFQLYLASIYWTVATLATVGYGDIHASTTAERLLSMFWMVFGVGFYSFTVGSLSSVLANLDTRQSHLASKIAVVEEFSKDAKVGRELKERIKQSLEYSSLKSIFGQNERDEFLSEIPLELKWEIANTMYKGLTTNIPFFKNRDKSFIAHIVPLLQPLKVSQGEIIYRIGEYPNNVYFIVSGRVNFVAGTNLMVYKSYVQGSYFGEVEIFLNTARMTTIRAEIDCDLLTIHKQKFLKVLREFPEYEAEMFAVAKERDLRNQEALRKIQKVLPISKNSKFWNKKRKYSLYDKRRLNKINDPEAQFSSEDIESEIEELAPRPKNTLQRILRTMSILGGSFSKRKKNSMLSNSSVNSDRSKVSPQVGGRKSTISDAEKDHSGHSLKHAISPEKELTDSQATAFASLDNSSAKKSRFFNIIAVKSHSEAADGLNNPTSANTEEEKMPEAQPSGEDEERESHGFITRGGSLESSPESNNFLFKESEQSQDERRKTIFSRLSGLVPRPIDEKSEESDESEQSQNNRRDRKAIKEKPEEEDGTISDNDDDDEDKNSIESASSSNSNSNSNSNSDSQSKSNRSSKGSGSSRRSHTKSLKDHLQGLESAPVSIPSDRKLHGDTLTLPDPYNIGKAENSPMRTFMNNVKENGNPNIRALSPRLPPIIDTPKSDRSAHSGKSSAKSPVAAGERTVSSLAKDAHPPKAASSESQSSSNHSSASSPSSAKSLTGSSRRRSGSNSAQMPNNNNGDNGGDDSKGPRAKVVNNFVQMNISNINNNNQINITKKIYVLNSGSESGRKGSFNMKASGSEGQKAVTSSSSEASSPEADSVKSESKYQRVKKEAEENKAKANQLEVQLLSVESNVEKLLDHIKALQERIAQYERNPPANTRISSSSNFSINTNKVSRFITIENSMESLILPGQGDANGSDSNNSKSLTRVVFYHPIEKIKGPNVLEKPIEEVDYESPEEIWGNTKLLNSKD